MSERVRVERSQGLYAYALDGLSVEQRQLQDQALKFASNELAPFMKEWDKKVKVEMILDTVLYLSDIICRKYFQCKCCGKLLRWGLAEFMFGKMWVGVDCLV